METQDNSNIGEVAVQDTTPSSVPTTLSEDTAAARTFNRTRTVINDDGDDPLNIDPPAKVEPTGKDAQVDPKDVKEEEEVKPEETKDEEEKTEPDEEEVKKARQEVGGHLDKILEEKTGVGLDGVVEAITTLLSWYNDILSIDMKAPENVPPQAPPAPAFQRSHGRTPLPAQTSYDFRKSEILAMDNATYQRRAQDITNAYLRGRVLNDVE